ncbi:CPBP family intramembrane glutamic endopeptidase [Fredinandcohnia sp. 179-A 10B2 NHS]|uniref:CPBP family intramembrane glutamic endopeptidase n=1 Tax=Fredinandcohnia sp. 179-A 10B2 NHS TaxID=3235176 RepID=UPI00399FAD91
MVWFLTLLLTISCIPGILFMLSSEKKILSSSEEDIPLLTRVITHILAVVLFSLAGSFFAIKTNLVDPFTKGILDGTFSWQHFTELMQTGVTYGLICSIANIAAYYFIFKRAVDADSFNKIEQHYQNMGIGARIFYGGVIEEIIFRLGIMGFIIWLGSMILSTNNNILIWVAILISSILFALAHVPGISSMGLKKTPAIMIYALGGNIWVGIWCGLAFLQAGIFAAIVVHILFHLLWYPIQMNSNKQRGSLHGTIIKK